MASVLQNGWRFVEVCRQAVSGAIYGTPDPFIIEGSEEALRDAIQEHGNGVLQYKFKEVFQTYSPLEYAVKLGDRTLITELISLGANVDKSEYCSGTMIHFYIDCLEGSEQSDLDLLRLLIDKVSDVNLVENNNLFTPIQYAVHCMVRDNKIHWDVLGLLLANGADPVGEYGSAAPFEMFVHASVSKSSLVEETVEYFENIVQYHKLEKQYYPDSENELLFDEFIVRSSHIKQWINSQLSNITLDTMFTNGARNILAGINEELERSNILQEDEEQLRQGIIECTNLQNGVDQTESERNAAIRQMLFRYYNWFEKLVVEGEFKQCFTEWELNEIKPLLSENSTETMVLRFFLFGDVA